MLTPRAVMVIATALAVAGLTAGCHVDRPATDRTAVVDGSQAGPADPLAGVDAELDAVEHDLDGADG